MLTKLGYVLVHPSKRIGEFPAVLNLNRFICNSLPALPDHRNILQIHRGSRNITTSNQLDLETLGFLLVMP